MKIARRFSAARFAAIAWAEFLKVWASKIPLVIIVALPVLVYLFVFALYHGERIADHLRIVNALDTLPILFFATWKSLLFQMSMLTFAAFWATVDSQYGMVRVACCQPVTRVEYLLGKWCGITAHVVIFTAVLVASELAWTALYSGVQGVGGHDVISVGWFTVEVTVFVVAFTSATMGLASVRRTVGSGIVIAVLGFIALAFMTMLPFRVVSPRFVLMRYFFFSLGELRNPFPGAGDSPYLRVNTVADFFLVVMITPLLFLLPAIVYFSKRDIVE